MLPAMDKPTLQYIIEEAVESRIEEILNITSRNKSLMLDLLEEVRRVSDKVNIHYIRQKEPKGLGHAIHCAKSFSGN
jgi:UTP--glucose-1-phosphate uridylyltransferase